MIQDSSANDQIWLAHITLCADSALGKWDVPPKYILDPKKIMVVGRSAQCQIFLTPKEYPTVSRNHAEFKLVRQKDNIYWEICDLDSTNGTIVNSLEISGCYPLKTGDRIRFGWEGPQFLFECQGDKNVRDPDLDSTQLSSTLIVDRPERKVKSSASEGKQQLFARIKEHIEQDPRNITAIYLTGVLSSLQTEDKDSVFECLQFSFQEGIKQRSPKEGLFFLYREAVRLKPEEAFSWLTKINSPWDTEEDLSLLLQEAANIYTVNSPQYHNLLLLKKIRGMTKLSDICQSISDKIAKLNQGIENDK